MSAFNASTGRPIFGSYPDPLSILDTRPVPIAGMPAATAYRDDNQRPMPLFGTPMKYNAGRNFEPKTNTCVTANLCSLRDSRPEYQKLPQLTSVSQGDIVFSRVSTDSKAPPRPNIGPTGTPNGYFFSLPAVNYLLRSDTALRQERDPLKILDEFRYLGIVLAVDQRETDTLGPVQIPRISMALNVTGVNEVPNIWDTHPYRDCPVGLELVRYEIQGVSEFTAPKEEDGPEIAEGEFSKEDEEKINEWAKLNDMVTRLVLRQGQIQYEIGREKDVNKIATLKTDLDSAIQQLNNAITALAPLQRQVEYVLAESFDTVEAKALATLTYVRRQLDKTYKDEANNRYLNLSSELKNWARLEARYQAANYVLLQYSADRKLAELNRDTAAIAALDKACDAFQPNHNGAQASVMAEQERYAKTNSTDALFFLDLWAKLQNADSVHEIQRNWITANTIPRSEEEKEGVADAPLTSTTTSSAPAPSASTSSATSAPAAVSASASSATSASVAAASARSMDVEEEDDLLRHNTDDKSSAVSMSSLNEEAERLGKTNGKSATDQENLLFIQRAMELQKQYEKYMGSGKGFEFDADSFVVGYTYLQFKRELDEKMNTSAYDAARDAYSKLTTPEKQWVSIHYEDMLLRSYLSALKTQIMFVKLTSAGSVASDTKTAGEISTMLPMLKKVEQDKARVLGKAKRQGAAAFRKATLDKVGAAFPDLAELQKVFVEKKWTGTPALSKGADTKEANPDTDGRRRTADDEDDDGDAYASDEDIAEGKYSEPEEEETGDDPFSAPAPVKPKTGALRATPTKEETIQERKLLSQPPPRKPHATVPAARGFWQFTPVVRFPKWPLSREQKQAADALGASVYRDGALVICLGRLSTPAAPVTDTIRLRQKAYVHPSETDWIARAKGLPRARLYLNV